MITDQRWQEIGTIFHGWNQHQKEHFCLFHVLTMRGTDGTPPNTELQEKLKNLMKNMGISFEEMEEVIQRLSAEEKQTFFGMSTTSDTQI